MCAQTQNKCSSCDSGDEGTSLYIDRQTEGKLSNVISRKGFLAHLLQLSCDKPP